MGLPCNDPVATMKPTQRPSASSAAQLVAALRKNFMIKKSQPISTVVETLLPLVFILGMVAIWAAVGGTQRNPGQSFVHYDVPYASMDALIHESVCINATPSPAPSLLKSCTADDLLEKQCVGRAQAVPLEGLCAAPGTGFQLHEMLTDFSNVNKLPTLDQLIITRWLLRASLDDWRTPYFDTLKPFSNPGDQVHFASNLPLVQQLVDRFNTTSELFRFCMGKLFTTEQEAEQHVMASENLGTTWFMVTLDAASRDHFDVALRFNRTSVFWGSKDYIYDRLYQGGEQPRDAQSHKLHTTAGFLTAQKTVQDWYITSVLGESLPPEPVFAMNSFPAWTDYIFLAAGAEAGFFQLFIVLSYLYPVSQYTKSLVSEKELRMREAMLIMGLGHGAFYTSWFLTYAVEILISSLTCMIVTKVTFYPRSDAGVIFFVFFLFGTSCITLAALVSTVFSKARAAALVSPVLFFLLSVPMFLIGNATAAVKGVVSLLSPSAMAIGVTLLAEYEVSGGLGPKQMASEADDLNMLGVLFMLAIDTILYAMLALYLDAVFPSEWGTRKHPLFCILEPLAWCFGKGRGGSVGDESGGNMAPADGRDPTGVFEDESMSTNPVVVRLAGLRKEFTRGTETFTAVNDLTLDMRENEVSVLLGHNGAGKSTTMNLMTGMLEITAGDCTIYGRSVRTQLSLVRQDIALCPQHNILWPDVTCAEHLRFFGAIKGLSGAPLDAAIDQMLHDVDMLEKKHELAGSLSGGQKRKLSVAIAFIGGSKLVILDEPSAGCDVAARRFMWDLIKRQARGRAVLLTTHFMDEAEILGSTIAIVSHGRLKCSGSSMFLKSRLGVGYSITLAMEPGAPAAYAPARQLVMDLIPAAVPMSSGSAEVAYRLPMDAAAQFPNLLGTLEQNGAAFHVTGYGITVTTLEEIFLKIAEDEEEEAGTSTTNASTVERALSGSDDDASPAVATEMNDIDEGELFLWTQSENSGETGPDGKHRHQTNYAMQFSVLFAKRLHNAKRDRRTQCLQILMPVICILLSFLLTLVEFIPDSPKLYFEPEMYRVAGIDELVIPTANCDFDHTLWAPSVVHDGLLADNASHFAARVLEGWDAHEDQGRFHSFFCNETLLGPLRFREPANAIQNYSVLFVNASAFHAMGEMLHYYYRIHAQTTLARANKASNVSIRVASHNMPWTDREAAAIESIKTFMIGIVIMIPFTLIPSTFVSWIVKEKECKAKHLQFVSGMNYWVYWLSNLTFDMLSFLVTVILVILIFLIFNRKEYIGGAEEFGAVFLLLFFFGLAGVSSSYLWGFFFKEHAAAQNVVMLGNFVFGFVLVILVLMLKLFESTETAGEALTWICRLVPAYCLGEGVINLAGLGFAEAFGLDIAPLDMEVTGYGILYMACEFPVFFVLALLLDHPNRQKRQQQLFHQPDVVPPAIEDEDVDVARERARIEGSTVVPYGGEAALGEATNLVAVRHLCKIYDNKKVAVRNLSFGIKQGEVFGFLGANGAGKTTTISIMCGEQMPTHGRCFVAGFDCVDEALDAQRNIGYCPQFDALLDLLTPREHLQLYAGLRGIPVEHHERVITTLLKVCELNEYVDTVAANLSGGNKRKLSVALALVGGPRVVFLDEPSAGMDAMSRRGLWEVITSISAHCAVVLCTHHLEEVEALAHRVAIMVDGKMMCIGDKTHLKNKFGSGFEMSIRVHDETAVAPLRDFVASTIPDARLTEYRALKFHYELPPASRLSEVFRQLEDNKDQLAITDYAVNQTSIESVFLRIVQGADIAEYMGVESPMANRAGGDVELGGQ